MDIEGEVNVTEQWRNWFLIGVILGLVNILVKISSFWPWFCKTKGANGVEPDEKKVFVMLIPRCLIGMILTTWIIFGTVYRFSDEGEIATVDLQNEGNFLRIALIAMYVVYVAPFALFWCMTTCALIIWWAVCDCFKGH